MRLREQHLVGMHLRAGEDRKADGRGDTDGALAEVVETIHRRRGVPLYEERLFDAATAAMLHRAPYRSTRKGAMRRWWTRGTHGAPVPPELLE